jgi:excisionase family DNA binding protein
MSTQTATRHGTVLLTPTDAARLASVSRDTIYREIERGALPALHVGRLLRIDPTTSTTTSPVSGPHDPRPYHGGTPSTMPIKTGENCSCEGFS